MVNLKKENKRTAAAHFVQPATLKEKQQQLQADAIIPAAVAAAHDKEAAARKISLKQIAYYKKREAELYEEYSLPAYKEVKKIKDGIKKDTGHTLLKDAEVKEELQNYIIVNAGSGYYHVKDIFYNYVYATFSTGNKKLKSNKYNTFLIFNLPQVLTCPNASLGCLGYCYCHKNRTSLKVKGGANFSRRKNYITTLHSNFSQILKDVVKHVSGLTAAGQQLNVRIHESGDFYNIFYAKKVIKVITDKELKSIHFTFYTKSVFMLKEFNSLNKHNNINAIYSIDNTTKAGILSEVTKNDYPTFEVLEGAAAADALTTATGNQFCNVKHTDFKTRAAAGTKALGYYNQIHDSNNKTKNQKLKTAGNKELKEVTNSDTICCDCMKCYKKDVKHILTLKH